MKGYPILSVSINTGRDRDDEMIAGSYTKVSRRIEEVVEGFLTCGEAGSELRLKMAEAPLMKKGLILPNGAMVIDFHVEEEVKGRRTGYIVLAFDDNSETCFITWWCGADKHDCAYGHYFRSLHSAIDDFEERCKMTE